MPLFAIVQTIIIHVLYIHTYITYRVAIWNKKKIILSHVANRRDEIMYVGWYFISLPKRKLSSKHLLKCATKFYILLGKYDALSYLSSQKSLALKINLQLYAVISVKFIVILFAWSLYVCINDDTTVTSVICKKSAFYAPWSSRI